MKVLNCVILTSVYPLANASVTRIFHDEKGLVRLTLCTWNQYDEHANESKN